MRINSFRTRLLLLFLLLTAGILATSLVTLRWVVALQSERSLERELLVSERVFSELMQVRTEQLQQAAAVLTADFGFREAIASQDQETIISALVNHGERIGTNLMVLQNAAGDEVAATHAVSALPSIAARTAVAAAPLILVQDEIFQIVTVPVQAPDLIAWATLGFRVDDELAKLLQQLTLADISFMEVGTEQIYASSLSAAERTILGNNQQPLDQRLQQLDLAAHINNLSQTAQLAGPQGLQVIFSSQRQQAQQEFVTLQQQYAAMALLLLILASLLAILTARKITEPLAQLTQATQRLGQGDYAKPIGINRGDEFGKLGTAFEAMRHDIAMREQQIVFQLEHDLLTELPNRVSLQSYLREAIESHQQGYIILLNVARFGEVNDKFGQQVADRLLQAIAQRLSALLSKPWWLARLAGDEFVLVGVGQTLPQVERLLEQLKLQLEQPWWLADSSYLLHFHSGYLAFTGGADAVDDLLRKAQLCARQARLQNRFAVAYQAGMDEQYLRRLQIVQALPKAVREQRLQLHYQPKLATATGTVVGVEALLRWRDEHLGVVRPDEFIPLAEQTGEIYRLTQWVISAGLAQLALWHEQGHKLSLAMNLSALDLSSPSLVTELQQQAKQQGIAPAWITLEVTESAVMEDPTSARAKLQALRELGFKIAIDDYGTGYASLAQLKQLPADELKLDRSFIQELAHSEVDQTIVQSTLALAHQLQLQTVAEGVEDQATWQVLQRLGCTTVQGFYFSRPLAAAELELWLKQHQQGQQA
ncbi:putative bifunctional diguanylate cyclase/phosphodiesterase [Pseudidiomarina sp. WS423]|uniref:putative bifunctional diguanylate cyclase/phosphodiesterase n=1 Tax=Pseudidiomarina sp. WS423 TaxID=3425124 RepID=UPI003D6DDEAE